MVCEWGMSEKIGPLTFGKKSEEIFLGKEISHARDYSDEISQIIDEEITSFVKIAEKNATKIITKYLENLNNIAHALLEYESISGNEMTQIINGESISREEIKPKKTRVRRRKNTKDEAPSKAKGAQSIVAKPATS